MRSLFCLYLLMRIDFLGCYKSKVAFSGNWGGGRTFRLVCKSTKARLYSVAARYVLGARQWFSIRRDEARRRPRAEPQTRTIDLTLRSLPYRLRGLSGSLKWLQMTMLSGARWYRVRKVNRVCLIRDASKERRRRRVLHYVAGGPRQNGLVGRQPGGRNGQTWHVVIAVDAWWCFFFFLNCQKK